MPKLLAEERLTRTPAMLLPDPVALGQAEFDVTVVIPLYNKAHFVSATLASVIAQSLRAREIIIVDDSSSDGSAEIVSAFAARNSTFSIRLVRQSNTGPGPARNRGIAEARSEWVALIDGDDLWRSDHLTTLAKVASVCPEADVLATRFRRLAQGATIGVNCATANSSIHEPNYLDYLSSPSPYTVSASNVALRRSVISKRGGFASFWPGEDFELWTRLALDHRFAAINRCTAFYVQKTGGLMDQWEKLPPSGFDLGPVYCLLNDAIRDPSRSDRRAAILAFRNRHILINIRQALFCGQMDIAGHYLRELDRFGRADASFLRLLARLPSPVMKAGLRFRAAVKRA